MTNRLGLIAVAVAAMWLVNAPEAAAQAPSCTVSATSVSFGTYNAFDSADRQSSGTVTYSCNKATNNISISLGPGSSGTFGGRTMTKGGEKLGYNLFIDAARSGIWGDGTSGTAIYTRNNPPPNNNVSVTIFASIAAGQDVSAGTYTDTVSVVINF